MTEKRLWLRVVRPLLAASALAATFVAAVLLGVVLHLNLPQVRRLAARAGAQALGTLLVGRFEIEPLDRISLGGIRIAKATVYDAHGRRVATLLGVDAGIDLLRLLRAIRSKDQILPINVQPVRAERIDAEVVPDATGYATIADAFSPKKSEGPSTGRSVRLELPRIEVASGRLNWKVGGVLVDSDLKQVHGGLIVGPDGLAVDVTRVDAVGHGYGTVARGRATLRLRVPGAIRATFDGSVGDSELHAKGHIEDGRVELTLDTPGAAPADVRRLLPSWPLEERVSVHAEANGDLPVLQVRGKVALGPTAVTVKGPVILGGEPRATLAFAGEHLDARSFFTGAPRTDVAADGSFAATSENGTFAAELRTHVSESEVNGYPVPALDAEATIRDGGMSGAADIHEPGMPTHATFRVDGDGTVDVDADAKTVDFRKARSLSSQRVAGRGGAHLRAHLANGNLTASLEAASAAVEVASVRISGARVSIQARGPIAYPEKLQGSARVTAKSIERGDLSLENVELDARGNLLQSTFDAKGALADGPEVGLAGTLALLGRPLLRDTRLSVRRGPVLAQGDIADYDPASESLNLRRLRVTGAGRPLTGSARISRDLVEVKAETESLDLGVLAHAFALPVPLDGRAHVSLSFEARRKTAHGQLRIGTDDLTLGAFRGVALQLSTKLDDERLTGAVSGTLAGSEAFGATWDVELAGPAYELASLRDATGTAELEFSDIELGRLDPFLSKEGPIEKVGGRVDAKLEIVRATKQALLPSLSVTAATRGLALTFRNDDGGDGRVLTGTDLETIGGFDAESGKATTRTRLRDSHGDIATLAGSVGIDVPRLVHEPERALSQLPIEVLISAPARRIGELPEGFRLDGVDGELGGNLFVQGTLARPELRATLDGRGIAVRGSRPPADLHAEVQLGSDGSLHAGGEAKLGKLSVATVTLAGTLPGGKPSAFRGHVELALNGLPLALAGMLSKNSVRGSLFGKAAFSRDEKGGALRGDLDIRDAVVDGAALGKGKIHVATDGQIANAKVAFSGERGSFDTEWRAGLTWNGLVPSFSGEVPVTGRVVAKNFGVGAVNPLVAGVLSGVGGHVDADMTLALTPKTDREHRVTWIGNIDGSAVLRDGTAIIDVLGVDVRNVSMSVRADGNADKTHISSADVKGNLRGSSDNLRGSVDLDLETLNLVRGSATLYANDTPLFVRGAPQGRVTGEATVRLTREPKRMLMRVDVPTLKLRLPEVSSRKVLDNADHPEITILQDVRPIERALTALPVDILVHLGRGVSLQRSDIELKVTGTPAIHMADEMKMAGSIELVQGGRLPVLGQVFVIDRGLVTFDGPPDDPTVNVTAEWRAPNNTIVFVQVTGRMKEAEVALRSEPPLPEREVFALLFGGATDPGSSDRSTGQEGSAARTAALQTSMQQLNGLLGQSDVELRVGSTSEARPRYTAAVRVGENLWFEASTYQQSASASDPSSNLSVVSGTIDYRFTRKWSLRVEAGTAGGALDLLWQHRY